MASRDAVASIALSFLSSSPALAQQLETKGECRCCGDMYPKHERFGHLPRLHRARRHRGSR